MIPFIQTSRTGKQTWSLGYKVVTSGVDVDGEVHDEVFEVRWEYSVS